MQPWGKIFVPPAGATPRITSPDQKSVLSSTGEKSTRRVAEVVGVKGQMYLEKKRLPGRSSVHTTNWYETAMQTAVAIRYA